MPDQVNPSSVPQSPEQAPKDSPLDNAHFEVRPGAEGMWHLHVEPKARAVRGGYFGGGVVYTGTKQDCYTIVDSLKRREVETYDRTG